jgi:TonB family protein
MRHLSTAFAMVILSATGHITAQEPVRQKQADREAVRSHCASHFLGEQKLPAAPLAVIYQQGALARETCSCAADRITSNDRLSNTIGTVQWAPETDLGRADTVQILGALLVCAGEAIEHRGQLPRSGGAVAGLEMARAAMIPDPTRLFAEGTPPMIDANRCKSKPEYPDAARRAGVEGRTRLAFYVNDVGRFTKVHIVRSSGDTPLHKLLDFNAVAAMSGCRWEPARKNDERYADWGFVDFVWRLK